MTKALVVLRRGPEVRDIAKRMAVWATMPGHRGQSGQGTVEYVGLILLVSLLMVGMVAAMKSFSGAQGTELAELIVDKIQSAVDKVTFR